MAVPVGCPLIATLIVLRPPASSLDPSFLFFLLLLFRTASRYLQHLLILLYR